MTKITVDKALIEQAIEALQNSQEYVCASADGKVRHGWGNQLDEAEDAMSALRATLAEPAVEPVFRTDQQIVDQTEELAKFLLAWKYGHKPETATPMRDAIHPKAEDSWQAACRVQEMLTDTDPMNAVAEVEDAPPPPAEVPMLSDEEPVAWLSEDEIGRIFLKFQGSLRSLRDCASEIEKAYRRKAGLK